MNVSSNNSKKKMTFSDYEKKVAEKGKSSSKSTAKQIKAKAKLADQHKHQQQQKTVSQQQQRLIRQLQQNQQNQQEYLRRYQQQNQQQHYQPQHRLSHNDKLQNHQQHQYSSVGANQPGSNSKNHNHNSTSNEVRFQELQQQHQNYRPHIQQQYYSQLNPHPQQAYEYRQEINKLDLIFEKEPEEVQEKLRKLLLNYNAVMQYNKDQDKFQVDLILPFASNDEKARFIEQFLKHRKKIQNESQHNQRSHSHSKSILREQQRSIKRNTSGHRQENKENNTSIQEGEAVTVGYQGENILSQSIREQASQKALQQNSVRSVNKESINFDDLSRTFDVCLDRALKPKNQYRQKQQKRYQYGHFQSQGQQQQQLKDQKQSFLVASESQQSNRIGRIGNSGSVADRESQQSDNDRIIDQGQQYQGFTGQNKSSSLLPQQPNDTEQTTAFGSPSNKSPRGKKSSDWITPVASNEDQYNPDQMSFPNTLHSPDLALTPIVEQNSFQHNIYESPINPIRNIANQMSYNSNTSSNQILIEQGQAQADLDMDGVSIEHFETKEAGKSSANSQHNQQLNDSSVNFNTHNNSSMIGMIEETPDEQDDQEFPTHAEYQDFLKKKQSKIQVAEQIASGGKGSIGNSNKYYQSGTVRKKQNLSNEKASIRRRYSEFLKNNHQSLEKIYQNIGKDIKKNIKRRTDLQKSTGQVSSSFSSLNNSREHNQILVVEEEEFEDMEQSSQSSADKQIRQQMLNEYRKRIAIENESMSSEDKVRYFKYLVKHARGLYHDFMRNSNNSSRHNSSTAANC